LERSGHFLSPVCHPFFVLWPPRRAAYLCADSTNESNIPTQKPTTFFNIPKTHEKKLKQKNNENHEPN
jgi:hypothetical protein